MTSPRAASRILALLLCYALLHPSLAAAVDTQVQGVVIPRVSARVQAQLAPQQYPGVTSLGTVKMAPAAAAPSAAVEAHPVIGILNDLQAKGVVLPQTLATYGDITQAREAAAALPEGAARQSILTLADAAHAAMSGGSAEGAKLDAAYDHVEAPKRGVRAWLSSSPWVPASIARSLSPYKDLKAIDPKTRAIPVERLRWTPAIDSLPQDGTLRLQANDKQIVGQDTALKAIHFGLTMPSAGYNLVVSGADGSGRATAVRHIADDIAASMPVPGDKAAVTNLDDSKKPVILSLPTGGAVRFKDAVKEFVETFKTVLPQQLKSPKVRELEKALTQQAKAQSQARRERFDAEVAKVRLQDGKLGLKIAEMPMEGGVRIIAVPALKDPKTGEFRLPKSKEELPELLAANNMTEEDLGKAQKDAEEAAQPFYEAYRAMAEEDEAAQAELQKEIGQIEGKVAGGVVEQLKAILQQAVRKQDPKLAERAAAIQAETEKRLKALGSEAMQVKLGQYGIALMQTQEGAFTFIITREKDGKRARVAPKELQQLVASGELSEAALSRALEPLQQKLAEISIASNQALEDLQNSYGPPSPQEQAALEYVEKLAAHAAEHYSSFLPPNPNSSQAELMERMKHDGDDLYRVSVLVDNSKLKHAPVVFDDEPSLADSFGKVETHTKGVMLGGGKTMQFESPAGPELEGGRFQQADGGIYVVDAEKALQAPGYWPTLMKAVASGKADIIGMSGDGSGIVRHGVPGKVKVVLIASPMIRMLLAQHDGTFRQYFRASADFEPTLSIGARAVEGYLQFMKNVIVKGAMPEFARDGVAAVLGESARMADSHEKLTSQFGRVYELMQRAAYWARESGAKIVGREHVAQAIAMQKEFTQGGERRLLEAYKSGSMAISTSGREVGQINGLAVMGSMGVPMQITVETGRGGRGSSGIHLWDQNAGFTGQLFNKALGVVDGFLLRMLGVFRPIKAKIAMSYEQQYGGIDGDSATSTEAYVILSALSGIPLRQDLAVTGSMNQKGRVQAIGGANEKTEGFFKVAAMLASDAKSAGFNGVLMPATNEKNLQLDPAVVQAVRDGKFEVYSIRNVREGWEILTGVKFEEAVRLARRNAGR